MTRTIIESSNYRQTITSDGTDTGNVIGNLSALVDSGNRTINITATLSAGSTMPVDSVVQQQLTDFVTQVRTQADAAGLTQFGEVTA